MCIKAASLAISFMILPAVAFAALRGTPLDTFKYVTREDIAKQPLIGTLFEFTADVPGVPCPLVRV